MQHGYWATIDHWRTWNKFDGPVRDQVNRDGGLTGYTAAAIAIEYNLLQSLPWKGGFARFHTVACVVNKTANNIRDDATMKEKADATGELAKSLIKGTGVTKIPSSAASKLLWFVRPKGWTMFDRHAFNAVFERRPGKRSEDLKDFYDVLGSSRFGALAAEVVEIGLSNGVPLNGERVLDKLLMLRGAARLSENDTFGDGVRELGREFFNREPNENVEKAAMQIDKLLSSELPPKAKEPRSRRS